MKRKHLTLSIVLGLALAAAAMSQEKPVDPAAKPKLVIASFTHDFGEVKPGTVLDHSFVVKNQGKGDLMIDKVTPGCGCTASNFDKVIAPGKEGKITLRIEHTESYSGELAKSALVATNDPANQTFNLMLRAYFKGPTIPVSATSAASPVALAAPGKIAGPFSVSPSDRWVTSVLTGSSSAGTLNLYNGSGTPVRVKKVDPGGTNFTVKFLTIEDGKRYEISVATNPALKPGQYHQTLKLVTDSKAAPEIAIELAATVYPKVFAVPSSVNFPRLTPDKDPSTVVLPVIYVRKLRDGGLKVNSVTSTLPFLKPTLSTQDEGSVYVIRLAVDKSKMEGNGAFKGTIRIETNDPDTPVLEVSVQGSFN
jgi:hypothetical protein